MKTLTEFDGFLISRGLNSKKELLGSGKTAEELPALLGEAFKFEGDKLTRFVNALEIVDGRSDNLKRVIIYSLNEGEKAPERMVSKDDLYYGTEYFFVPAAKNDRKGRGGKGDRHGKKGGKFAGKGKERGGRENRKPRPDSRKNPDEAFVGKPSPEGHMTLASAGEKKRAPRPPRQPRAPKPKKEFPPITSIPTPGGGKIPFVATAKTEQAPVENTEAKPAQTSTES